MLTRLYVENFRAFKQESVDLSKINLFFGRNNGGKSSLSSALNLFSQIVQSAYNDSEVMLSGEFEDSGAYYDVVNGNDESKNIKIGIEADITIPRRSFVKGVRGGRLLRRQYTAAKYRLLENGACLDTGDDRKSNQRLVSIPFQVRSF